MPSKDTEKKLVKVGAVFAALGMLGAGVVAIYDEVKSNKKRNAQQPISSFGPTSSASVSSVNVTYTTPEPVNPTFAKPQNELRSNVPTEPAHQTHQPARATETRSEAQSPTGSTEGVYYDAHAPGWRRKDNDDFAIRDGFQRGDPSRTADMQEAMRNVGLKYGFNEYT